MEELEAEEGLRFDAGMYSAPKLEMSETMKEIRELAQKIRDKKKIMKQEAMITKQSTKPVVPRTAPSRGRDRSVTKLRQNMSELGVDMSGTQKVRLLYFQVKLIFGVHFI